MFGLLFVTSIVLQQFKFSVHAEEANRKHCPRNLDSDIAKYSFHEKGYFRQWTQRGRCPIAEHKGGFLSVQCPSKRMKEQTDKE